MKTLYIYSTQTLISPSGLMVFILYMTKITMIYTYVLFVIILPFWFLSPFNLPYPYFSREYIMQQNNKKGQVTFSEYWFRWIMIWSKQVFYYNIVLFFKTLTFTCKMWVSVCEKEGCVFNKEGCVCKNNGHVCKKNCSNNQF